MQKLQNEETSCVVFLATFLFAHVDFTDKLLMCSYCSSFGTQEIIDLPESKGKHIVAAILRLVAANCKLCPACRHSSQRSQQALTGRTAQRQLQFHFQYLLNSYQTVSGSK